MGHWTPDDIPDLANKVAIVTGANRGLGFEAAQLLASHGATVVLAVRSLSKGEMAKQAILAAVPEAKLEVMVLELGNLSTIETFAEIFKARYDRLDILMNSAGIMAVPEGKTEDGFELQLGVNHLGHFALTGWLFDILAETEGSRVVNVSSMAAHSAEMQWADLQYEQSYNRFGAYGQSKLANLLFTYGLQERLSEHGASSLSVAAHPGLSATDLQEGTEINIPIITPILFKLYKMFAMNADKGSQSQVRAAVDASVSEGDYYGPHRDIRGYPVQIEMPEQVTKENADRLWAYSEKVTGVSYPV